MLVPLQRPSAAHAAAPRCLAHSRWLARCPACTAYHLTRLQTRTAARTVALASR